MKYLLGGLVSASLVASPTNAQNDVSSDSMVFSPDGTWQLNAGDESCELGRRFSSPDHTVIAQIQYFGVTSRIALLSTDLRADNDDNVLFDFSRGNESGIEAVKQSYVLPEGYEGAIFRWAPPFGLWLDGLPSSDDLVQLADVHFSASGVFDRPIQLEFGEMTSAHGALSGCMRDLYLSWGMDEAALASVALTAEREDFRSWARQVVEDVPRRMRSRGRTVAIHTNVAVGPEGHVNWCHGYSQEGASDFAALACESLRKYARYKPAEDEEGNPVLGRDAITVVYVM